MLKWGNKVENLIGGLPDGFIVFILFGYLLLGIYLTGELLRRSKGQDAIGAVLFFFSLVFNGFNFYLINDLMTVPPQKISGNGNPFIPYIFMSFLLFLSFCFVFSKNSFEILLKKHRLISLTIALLALVLGYFSMIHELELISMIRVTLYYPMSTWLNWWKDIHLNSLYFNLDTFLFGMSISGFIADILAFVTKR